MRMHQKSFSPRLADARRADMVGPQAVQLLLLHLYRLLQLRGQIGVQRRHCLVRGAVLVPDRLVSRGGECEKHFRVSQQISYVPYLFSHITAVLLEEIGKR